MNSSVDMRRIVQRELRLRVISVLLLTASACDHRGSDSTATRKTSEYAPAAEARRIAEATPEWERNITHLVGSDSATALRAGKGLVAAVFGATGPHWIFQLAQRGIGESGGPYYADTSGLLHPAIIERSDVVGIAPSGHVWFLDAARGRVVSQDIGGYGVQIASLGVRGSARTGCAVGERSIVFLDAARPREVIVRELGSAGPTRSLPLDAEDLPVREAEWSSLRFGGSADGSCVLFGPHLNHLLVATDSGVKTLGPFIERVESAPRRRWWLTRLASRSTEAPAPPPGAIHATSFPGGVAVLFAGRSDDAGRVVDLYEESGEYVESMRLSRRAQRIAGTRHRLITIEVLGDSSYIASYVLPPSMRALPTAEEPSVTAPLSPDRVLPGKDSAAH